MNSYHAAEGDLPKSNRGLAALMGGTFISRSFLPKDLRDRLRRKRAPEMRCYPSWIGCLEAEEEERRVGRNERGFVPLDEIPEPNGFQETDLGPVDMDD